jgi:outer membrane protein OmpA-like peptidoglycan-associated protein
MLNPTRRISVVVLLVLAAVIVSGCASRKYVRHEVAIVEPQIAEVRDAQAQQAERIDAVDRRAEAALATADRATTSAEVANDRSAAAGRRAAEAERRAEAAGQDAHRALNRADIVEEEMKHRFNSLDKYAVADEKTVTFKFDSEELTNEAMSKLDDIAGWVVSTGSRYLIELQGFTDGIGTEKYNFGLSERRAESVLRYLVSMNVPLNRISIVGIGKTNPVADNVTAKGREQNRRVEIRVLWSSAPMTTANR